MNYDHIRHGAPIENALVSSVERLTAEYQRVFSRETVAQGIDDTWERLTQQATVLPPFFPTMVERFAHDQLRAAAQVDGLIPKPLPEILFCRTRARRSLRLLPRR